MFNNPFSMVVAIVLIVTIGRVLRAAWGVPSGRESRREMRYRKRHGLMSQPEADPETDRMREEIKVLKERIAVLERLATDNNSAIALDREIEKLR